MGALHGDIRLTSWPDIGGPAAHQLRRCSDPLLPCLLLMPRGFASGFFNMLRLVKSSCCWCGAERGWPCCAGKRVVSISAGKTRTAYVTEGGDIYVWETRPPKVSDERPAPAGPAPARSDALAPVRAEPVRVDGVKRVVQVRLVDASSAAPILLGYQEHGLPL